jgi:hypothetical protein
LFSDVSFPPLPSSSLLPVPASFSDFPAPPLSPAPLSPHPCLPASTSLNLPAPPRVPPQRYPFLAKNKRGHWNSTVDELTENVINMYRDYDASTFAQCEANHETRLVELEQADVYRKETWSTMDA